MNVGTDRKSGWCHLSECPHLVQAGKLLIQHTTYVQVYMQDDRQFQPGAVALEQDPDRHSASSSYCMAPEQASRRHSASSSYST